MGLLTFFIDEIKKEYLQKKEINPDQVIEKICYFNNLEKVSSSEVEKCHHWFKSIYLGGALDNIIHTHFPFDELVIHAEEGLCVDKEKYKIKLSNNQIFDLFYFLSGKNSISWNNHKPFVSFELNRLDKKFRITLLHPSLNNKNKTKVFLRNINEETFKLNAFIDNEDIRLLENLIHDRKNIIIAGATGSGKTSLINSLLNYVSEEDHTVIIEDTRELISKKMRSTFLTSSNAEDLKDFCSHALRITPNRIILGEIRSKEIVPFILASNTGHKGLISTIHANSAQDTLARLTTLFSFYSEVSANYEIISKLIHSCVEYVIFMKEKKVAEIIKVNGVDGMKTIYDQVFPREVHATDDTSPLSSDILQSFPQIHKSLAESFLN